MLSVKSINKNRRQNRLRAKISGSAVKPRLCVYRSNNSIYAQIVDDDKRITLFSTNDRKIKTVSNKELSGKMARAYEVGLELGKKAIDAKISQVVFDRAGYKYHGRVKQVAEGARKAGLNF